MEKIGHVTLKEWQPGRWLIRYKDPNTGKDIRLKLSAGTYPQAVDDAEQHNRYCRGEFDTPPHLQIKKKQIAAGLTVEQAMRDAETELNYGKDALRNYRIDSARFVEYATENKVTRWKLVTRELIRKYYRYMKDCNLAHDTIRLRLLPISITSSYYALESSEYTDEYRRAKISHKRPKGWEPEIQFLTMEQTRGFLAYLKDNCEPKYYAMAMLGFHTGMRQLEIANLRPCDIDIKAGIITVTSTDDHSVKTEQSKREIPVPPQVIKAIKDWPIDPAALLFTSNGGCHYDANMLSKEWRKHVLKPARAAGKVPEWYTAKKCRPTFATLAGETGVDEVHLQRMLGHSPTNTMRKFYRSISVNKLAEQLAEFWHLLSLNNISETESMQHEQ